MVSEIGGDRMATPRLLRCQLMRAGGRVVGDGRVAYCAPDPR